MTGHFGVVRSVLITFLLRRKQLGSDANHARDWYAGGVSALNLIALPFIGFVIPQKCFEIAKECLRERLAMWFTKLFHLLSCSEMISFSFTLSE